MIFLDTNVLLRLLDATAPEHGVIRNAVAVLESRGEQIPIGLQVLVETWVVATRPVANNGLGWPGEAAAAVIEAARSRFVLLCEDETTASRWLDIVVQSGVVGKRAHDARIVALMASHGIDRILTLNQSDFAGIRDVSAVHPATVSTH